MKYLLAITLTLFCTLVTALPTYAHVLIPDSTGSKGLIVHIMPDDDPIAGQPSTIYLDIQDIASVSSITLRVTDQANKVVDVPVKIDSSLSSATYQFPQQGVYRLTVIAKSGDKTYTFHHSQRVSKGNISSSYQYPQWTEIVLTTTGILFIILVGLAINYRHDIKKHSQF